MNEPFNISVNYQGTVHELRARFERWGYTHRIAVLIDEHTYIFEPDEEGSYRALTETAGVTNIGLLQAVAEKLAKLSVA